jgi:hypothetical protein
MANKSPAPGVIIKEFDQSQIPNAAIDNNITVVTGFSQKGPANKVSLLTDPNEVTNTYGYPTNEAERYFINSCLDVVKEGGVLAAVKLPYGTPSAAVYSGARYNFVGNTTAGAVCTGVNFGTLSQSSLNGVIGGDYSVLSGTPLEVTVGSIVVVNTSIDLAVDGDGDLHVVVMDSTTAKKASARRTWLSETAPYMNNLSVYGENKNQGIVKTDISGADGISSAVWGLPTENMTGDMLLVAVCRYQASSPSNDGRGRFNVVEAFTGSLNPDKKDSYGASLFIEDVVNNASRNIKIATGRTMSISGDDITDWVRATNYCRVNGDIQFNLSTDVRSFAVGDLFAVTNTLYKAKVVRNYASATGTVSGSSGATTLTGTSTLFSTEVVVGAKIIVNGQELTVATTPGATSVTFAPALSANVTAGTKFTFLNPVSNYTGTALNVDTLAASTLALPFTASASSIAATTAVTGANYYAVTGAVFVTTLTGTTSASAVTWTAANSTSTADGTAIVRCEDATVATAFPATTAVAVNKLIFVTPNLYRCTIAGTTAASTTPVTAAGSVFTSGTATFVSFGAIGTTQAARSTIVSSGTVYNFGNVLYRVQAPGTTGSAAISALKTSLVADPLNGNILGTATNGTAVFEVVGASPSCLINVSYSKLLKSQLIIGDGDQVSSKLGTALALLENTNDYRLNYILDAGISTIAGMNGAFGTEYVSDRLFEYTWEGKIGTGFDIPAARVNSQAYLVGQYISVSGVEYRCTVAGSAAGSAPTFTTNTGDVIVDGTVTWLCVGDKTFFNETHYKLVRDRLDTFTRLTRKDLVLILDLPRHFFVSGRSSINETFRGSIKEFVFSGTSETNVTFLDSYAMKGQNNLIGRIRSALDLESVTPISTSYAASYANWLKVRDPFNRAIYWHPSSSKVLKVMLKTDAEEPWFAPAGVNRAVVGSVLELGINLDNDQMGEVYKYGINPIVNMPPYGFVVWGQKTLLTYKSAFDRLNVRKLFLAMERRCGIAAIRYVFQNNTVSTRLRLANECRAILDYAKSRDGIDEYILVSDETNNGSDVKERNELVVDISIDAARTGEFINISFVASRSAALSVSEVTIKK